MSSPGVKSLPATPLTTVPTKSTSVKRRVIKSVQRRLLGRSGNRIGNPLSPLLFRVVRPAWRANDHWPGSQWPQSGLSPDFPLTRVPLGLNFLLVIPPPLIDGAARFKVLGSGCLKPLPASRHLTFPPLVSKKAPRRFGRFGRNPREPWTFEEARGRQGFGLVHREVNHLPSLFPQRVRFAHHFIQGIIARRIEPLVLPQRPISLAHVATLGQTRGRDRGCYLAQNCRCASPGLLRGNWRGSLSCTRAPRARFVPLRAGP